MNEIEPLKAGIDGKETVWGIYSSSEYITSKMFTDSVKNGISTIIKEVKYIAPSTFDLAEWACSIGTSTNFLNAKRALIFTTFGVLDVSFSRGKLEIEANGTPDEVNAFFSALDQIFKRAENLIEWLYGSHGESISVPLNYRPAIQSAYPFLEMPVNDVIDDYLNSDACVIILIGPPGTGKTSFIKNLIHRSKSDAKISYDEKILNSDGMFAGFIEDDSKFLVIEDADVFLSAREDGNSMMHRFLNVSDGLISATGKKLVFSTNLSSIRDVDSALIRPGRCYAVLEFRALTRAEAQNVADEIGTELPDGSSFTLAEVCGSQPASSGKVNRRVGFC